MEACEVDQFEMHLRAVVGLPCPPPRMRVPCALMLNVLGEETMEATKAVLHRALTVPGAGVHWYAKLENRPGRKMAHITITANSIAQLRERAELLGVSQDVHKLPRPGPRVGVIMGSDSDLSVMKDAAAVLEEFGVPFELTIVSAHRTPARMYAYAQGAAEKGLQVIIAGAGGAAHLPGMVAALTSLPVVGVPMPTSAFGGNDSLMSIVQMPRGVPVATVAVGNATNAALLAVRILAAQDTKLLARMDAYMLKQEEDVLRKAAKLENGGYKAYV
jgi:phosphoribosylaminoimidazole carboxylase